MIAPASAPVQFTFSEPFLVVLVSWLAISFAAFWLFASRPYSVIEVVLLWALTASGALRLVLERYRPFTGSITISNGPLYEAVSHIGH